MATKIKYTQFLPSLGVSKLKTEQKQIITSVLNNKDTISILPTGFGKSLCYVLPHLITKRNVIIVSSLVSLIRDQEQKYKNVCNTYVLHGGRVAYNGTENTPMYEEIKTGKVVNFDFHDSRNIVVQKKLGHLFRYTYYCY